MCVSMCLYVCVQSLKPRLISKHQYNGIDGFHQGRRMVEQVQTGVSVKARLAGISTVQDTIEILKMDKTYTGLATGSR